MNKQICIAALTVSESGELSFIPPEGVEMTEKQFLAVQFLSTSYDEYIQLEKGNDPYGSKGLHGGS